MKSNASTRVEWPTVWLCGACYALWGALVFDPFAIPDILRYPLLALCVTLHSSLCHEAVHGHPTPSAALNEALVFPPLALLYPWRRFRDLHRAHHASSLTDPVDDPESQYWTERTFEALPGPVKQIVHANMTLAGRLVLGPFIAAATFALGEVRAARAGAPGLLTAWLLHGLGLVLVLGMVAASAATPVWAYVLFVALPSLSLLGVRTFIEHRPGDDPAKQCAIVEGGALFTLLFLANNFHAVHHARPDAPWYRLRTLYKGDRHGWLASNGNYRFRSYGEVARRFAFRAPPWLRDPVAGSAEEE